MSAGSGGGSFGAPVGSLGGFTGGGSFTGGGGSFEPGPGAAPQGKRGVTVAWDPTATGAVAAQLREARQRVLDAARALRTAPDLRVPAGAGIDAARLATCADELAARTAALARLADELERLADTTLLAGRAYEHASQAVRGAIEELAGHAAWAGGRLLGAGAAALGGIAATSLLGLAPVALAVGLAAVPLAAWLATSRPDLLARAVAAAPGLAATASRGTGGAADAAMTRVDAFLQQTSGFWDRAGEALLATPGFAAALRLGVESADEMAAGFLGVPLPVVEALERGIGEDELLALLAGGAAIGVRAGAGVGQVRPAVLVRDTTAAPTPVTAPAEAMRVLRGQPDQVVVHELRQPDGSRRFQVFVDGTQDFGLSRETGLDGLANVENGAAAVSAHEGSAAALAEALRSAGVGPGDAVDLFGYSQGGHAAMGVAASGDFDVRSVTTIGSPVDGLDVPQGVAVLPLAQAGDLVPAAMGSPDEPGRLGELVAAARGVEAHAPAAPTIELAPAHGVGSGAFARHDPEGYLVALEGAPAESTRMERFVDRLERQLDGAEGVATTSVRLRREGV